MSIAPSLNDYVNPSFRKECPACHKIGFGKDGRQLTIHRRTDCVFAWQYNQHLQPVVTGRSRLDYAWADSSHLADEMDVDMEDIVAPDPATDMDAESFEEELDSPTLADYADYHDYLYAEDDVASQPSEQQLATDGTVDDTDQLNNGEEDGSDLANGDSHSWRDNQEPANASGSFICKENLMMFLWDNITPRLPRSKLQLLLDILTSDNVRAVQSI
jgi:hypothetical protein